MPLNRTMRTDGRPSREAVARATASAASGSSARASSYHRENCRNGSGSRSARRSSRFMASLPAPSARPLAAADLAPVGGGQHDLPEANGGGRGLHGLVLPDELEGLLERELAVGDQAYQLLRGRGSHVREPLLLGRVHVHVL